jgi:hypothetical protein
MNYEFSTHQILKKLLGYAEVTVAFFDKAAYDSARTSLLKQFKKNCALLESMDHNPYEGKYLKATFNRDKVEGTFKLEDDMRKTNIKNRRYNIVDIKEL